MYYYEIAIFRSATTPFTYQSTNPIPMGTIVEVKLRSKVTQGFVYKEADKPEFKTLDILEVLDLRFSKSYIKIFEFISYYYSCSIGESSDLFTPLKIDKLASANIDTKIDLSPQQKDALLFIQEHDLSLLFGDTGSGKSEVYMKLFEETINRGKSALFLMPEIALTPQMLDRLKEKFGKIVQAWHSKITKKRKQEILKAIQNGEVRLVVGARSALFLPLKELDLIVVDEEHDDSYKASNRPRYHARDVAIYMGKVLGARVVLGSATPSLTSYHKFATFRLKGTYFQSSKRYIFDDSSSDLSGLIINEIKKSLDRSKQVVVFLPTRANFKYLICQDCGSFVECPFCSVGMSLHLDANALKCHYCNYTEVITKICPKCSHNDMRVKRIGTAQVVKRLEEIFTNHTIKRFDRDAITTQKRLDSLIKEFNDKKIDILVGTQMLSKGHNYLDVDLAVIIGIDSLLMQSDFRARERAMSLLLQIAGRSGRSGEGRVVVQTQNREFFQRYLDDYEEFLKDELEYRKGLYPPFKRLMRVVLSGKNTDALKEELLRVGSCLDRIQTIDLVGAGEAPIAKISNKYRFQILLRSTSPKALIKAINRCKTKSCEIDIDPVSFS